MNNQKLTANGIDIAATKGETYNIIGNRIVPITAPSAAIVIAWDAWVASRVDARDAATLSVMHEANLTSPVPGLAELAGKGTFAPCAPYGTCWVPTNGWTQQSPDTTSTVKPSLPQSSDTSPPIKPSSGAQRYTVSVSQLAQSSSQTSSRHGVASALLSYDGFDDFPCDPWRLWYRRTLFAYPDNLYPYDWAVCHAGFWIYRQNRYMWVAGTHKHHHCPVHWVKYQGKLAYVPMHPRDQRGLPPVNLRHGLYTFTGQPAHSIDRVALDGKSPAKLLDSTPKEFSSPAPALLARADSPQIAVHMMHESPRSSMTAVSSRAVPSSSLSFDQHSNRFILATRVTDAGHTHTFTEPMSDRGGHITPSSGGSFRGGSSGGVGYSHTGSFSGGGGGHYSGGGGSSAGHSGGGSSAGSGGHSGGGGGSSSSGSSSGGAGGGHH